MRPTSRVSDAGLTHLQIVQHREILTVGMRIAEEAGISNPSVRDAVWELLAEAADTLKRLPDRERRWLRPGSYSSWPQALREIGNACEIDGVKSHKWAGSGQSGATHFGCHRKTGSGDVVARKDFRPNRAGRNEADIRPGGGCSGAVGSPAIRNRPAHRLRRARPWTWQDLPLVGNGNRRLWDCTREFAIISLVNVWFTIPAPL